MITIKHIGEETCAQCGAAPTQERAETYAGLLHEERRFVCGRILEWSTPGSNLGNRATPCPKSQAAIDAKRRRVQAIRSLLSTLSDPGACPIDSNERASLADRIKAEFWRDVKEEDLR